jgi:flagellin-like hook-associated protein FlgL
MYSILLSAGWPIWPLLFISIIGLAIIIERAWYLRQIHIFPKDSLEQVFGVANAISKQKAISAAEIEALSQISPVTPLFCCALSEKAAGSSTYTNSASTVSGGLDDSFELLTEAQQRSGGISAQVDNAKLAITAIGTQVAATASALLDTDMAAATAAYTRSQTLLNAAQAMFARLQQSNLFSKL